MQHNWLITGTLLLCWVILLFVSVLWHLRTAMLLMPIILIVLLFYISTCLGFLFFSNPQPPEKIASKVDPRSIKRLSHLLKEHKDGDKSN